MGEQTHQTSIPRDDGGRGKRHHRIFHAPKRETRRKHQHIVIAPSIFAKHFTGGIHHFLKVGKLPSRFL